MRERFLLILILILSLILRLYKQNWDNFQLQHPDERALLMWADTLNFQKNLEPPSFNYGSFPLYLLKVTSDIFAPSKSIFEQASRARTMSALVDTGTVFLIYILAINLGLTSGVALISSLLYSISFFPIQNAHFFIVDPFLTFAFLLSSIILVRILRKPKIVLFILLGASLALAFSIKFTAIIFILAVVIVLLASRQKIVFIITTLIFVLFTHSILMPFAYNWAYSLLPHSGISTKIYLNTKPLQLLSTFINPKFIQDISLQTQMSSDPFIFPYTLQYVTTTPYLYFLAQIFFWGLGPIVFLLTFYGLFNIKNYKYLLPVLLVNLLFFLVIGRSSVKFMRYLLPLYPLLTILAGAGLMAIYKKTNRVIFTAILLITIFYSTLFFTIYFQPNTRISAESWARLNIPIGSTIAVEHWDDRPINSPNYNFKELTIYDRPDNPAKWNSIVNKLSQSDYLVLASNRLFTPLPKLSDCEKYKSNCYPLATQYYQDLFAQKPLFNSGPRFILVKQFHVYPQINIFGKIFGLDDQAADESFTVYDHPQIYIFKKSL